MTSTHTDRAIDVDALTAFLRSAGLSEGPLTVELISGGKSNLTFAVSSPEGRWALRRPPLGDVLPGSHDVLREARIISALEGSQVPVPHIAASDETGDVIGTAFYLMDLIDGTVVRDHEAVSRLDRAQRRGLSEALVDTLADLHDIDPEAVGLGALGRPAGFLARQLDRWTRQYESIRVRELPLVQRIAQRLAEDIPVTDSSSVIHGDFRIDNVMVASDQPARILAVLDWELATRGDALADLGMFVMFWDEAGRTYNPITNGLTAADGFLTVDEVLERYVVRRGIGNVDLDWYLAFSRLKLAVILEQIHARHVAGNTVGSGFTGLDTMVDQLLGEAATSLRL